MNQLSNSYERRPAWGFPRVGHGTSCGHHGEIFQGQLENSHGDAHRCLVSLPCYDLYSRAVFTPDSTSSIRVEPAGKLKSKRAVEMTVRSLDVPSCGGVLTIHNNIEESKGYGSSTADCVAAVLATADAFGYVFADHEVARLVVAAETASDNIMFARAVLFAQREGRVLEDYGAPFPHLVVLGVDTDEIGRVDTLDCEPTRYSWEHTCRFRPLIAGLRRALRRHDLDLLCRIATASAVINQQFLPKPMFADLLSLAKSCGVPGVAVAHSGTVLSFLLDGARPGVERIAEGLRRELESLGLTRVSCFHTTRSKAAFLAV